MQVRQSREIEVRCFSCNVKGSLSFDNKDLLKFDSQMVESVLVQESRLCFQYEDQDKSQHNQAFS